MRARCWACDHRRVVNADGLCRACTELDQAIGAAIAFTVLLRVLIDPTMPEAISHTGDLINEMVKSVTE